MMLALEKYYNKTKQSHAKHLITWIHGLKMSQIIDVTLSFLWEFFMYWGLFGVS